MNFHSGCPLPFDHLMRVIAGILADEISRETRRSPPIGETLAWNAETSLDEDGVGLDSLLRLQAAGRVADFFALRDVGYEDYLLVRKTLGDWAKIVEMSWAVKHETVTFRTSGSTGPGKACTHPFSQLVTEAVTLARIAGRPKRIVSLVAPHHIYGFLHTVVSSAALGLEWVDLRAVAPGSRLTRLRDDDLVVATPFAWKMIADEGGRFEGHVMGMTSTAPMSVELADRLAEMGLARLIEIYGSSETSGVGWRSSLTESCCPGGVEPASASRGRTRTPLRCPTSSNGWTSVGCGLCAGRTVRCRSPGSTSIPPASPTRSAAIPASPIASCAEPRVRKARGWRRSLLSATGSSTRKTPRARF
jgi:hypothetical protein